MNDEFNQYKTCINNFNKNYNSLKYTKCGNNSDNTLKSSGVINVDVAFTREPILIALFGLSLMYFISASKAVLFERKLYVLLYLLQLYI